ncbi:MAG: hypothetical protein ACRDGG_06180 [Anaerolineae bacterium]
MAESIRARLWAFGLGLLTLIAALLVVVVNPLEAALAYLALLAGVIAIGLMTNVWGGLMASALSVFAIVLFNQYAGIYTREHAIFNIATELAAFLFVGPLAGGLAGAIDRVQRQADRWLARVEELGVHDETLGTLKPEWAKARLDEEVLRAARFERPLSIVLLQLDPRTGAPLGDRAEREAALRGLIRVARAATQPPTVVAHAGGDRVLIILPEQTADQARRVADALHAQIEREVYFPYGREKSLGRPIGEWGYLHAGLASLNGQAMTGEALMAKVQAELVMRNNGTSIEADAYV